MQPNRNPTRIPSVILVLAALSSALVCRSQVLSIDVGNVLLDPAKPGQTFDLFVNNSGPGLDVGGLQLNLQVTVPTGQGVPRPVITGVDILSGTVFSTDNAGPFGGQ